jgi:hypothetical protein
MTSATSVFRVADYCAPGNEYRAFGRWRWAVLLCLTGLAVLPYARASLLPFIADDYVQIWLARIFGPVTGWKDLAADPLYRCRSTSLVLTYWTERLFGLNPIVYNWTSIGLHVLNTWLVFAAGMWRPIGWRLSAVAGGFFAVYEGHQEAVIWYAALPELLVFSFTVAAFLAWVVYLQTGRVVLATGTTVLFGCALLSKESAVVLVPLMLLAAFFERTRPSGWFRWWLVSAAIAGVYTCLVFLGKTNHLHFHDGTFALNAPFWITIPRSMFRLYWVWGFLALAGLATLRSWKVRARLLVFSGLWAVICFIPYSFLTYMPFVPSRHTYLASVGLALVVGAAVLAAVDRSTRGTKAAAALALLIVMPNCLYLWTRKQKQYEDRAAPTEQLVEFARTVGDPVRVHCFPYGFDAAEWAVRIRLHKGAVKIDSPVTAGQAVFCYPPHPHRSTAVAGGKPSTWTATRTDP